MSTLVIAFDGLDKELIEEFELKHIPQKEFGKIDNHTDISNIVTSELFASFITGTTSEKHGVKSLVKWSNPKIENFENRVSDSELFNKFKNLRHAIFESVNSLEAQKRKYRKEDLRIDTFFEEIKNSRAIFVPSYNPSTFWMIGADLEPIKYGYSLEETADHYETREHIHRKKELFNELENDLIEARDLLMCHFHKSDTLQHLYGDKHVGVYNEDKLKTLYKQIDSLAEKIKNKAQEKGYDKIIFMSDHGLPSAGTVHNKNAFYSANFELFGDQEPHITDFHDKIVDTESGE